MLDRITHSSNINEIAERVLVPSATRDLFKELPEGKRDGLLQRGDPEDIARSIVATIFGPYKLYRVRALQNTLIDGEPASYVAQIGKDISGFDPISVALLYQGFNFQGHINVLPFDTKTPIQVREFYRRDQLAYDIELEKFEVKAPLMYEIPTIY